MTVWNEAMYFFSMVPTNYRKFLVVLRDNSEKRGKTLGQYYLETYNYLIPNDVKLLEFDDENKIMTVLKDIE